MMRYRTRWRFTVPIHDRRRLYTSDFGTLRDTRQFFGQKDGCLDQNCPFLHDRDAALANRAMILENRRKTFNNYKHRPTKRQKMSRYLGVLDCVAGNDEALRADIEHSGRVDRDIGQDRAYCANPRCMKPWKEGEDRKPLKSCKRCKFTMYCSVSTFKLGSLYYCSYTSASA